MKLYFPYGLICYLEEKQTFVLQDQINTVLPLEIQKQLMNEDAVGNLAIRKDKKG